MSKLHGLATRLSLIFSRKSAEARMNSEFQFHIEMETDRIMREDHVERSEARRRALVAFGGVEQHREELRDGRGTAWIGGLSLDFRLGLRMLAKYPGLTMVGLLGLSVAVTIAALGFSAVDTVVGATLPFDEGDRIVSIDNFNVKKRDEDRQTHLRDLEVWRKELSTVTELSTYRTVDRNLITGNIPFGSVRVAEMAASGFRLTRVPPELGRYLNDEDQKVGAPDVVVIGHDIWQGRFGGRDIIGSKLQLGSVTHTVVGVMPEGFAFPVNNQVWTPLRLNAIEYDEGKAPSVYVFGRLAPNARIEDAKAEVEKIGKRLTTQYPRTHENILPRIRPYAGAFVDGPTTELLLQGAKFALSLLLVVIGTNVAVLVYARTASREAELAVRTALGASRRRIVTQLFAEALVLSTMASVIGLVIAHFVFQRVEQMVRQSAEGQMPFWMRLEITPAVTAYVAALAVLAAVIIGVVPALKATRATVSANLQNNFGGSSKRLGRTWTALLIAQVAVSVAALPVAAYGGMNLMRGMLVDRSTPATRSFVIATPLPEGTELDQVDDSTSRSVYANRVNEVTEKLRVANNGAEVVMMSSPPGAEQFLRIQMDRPVSRADSARSTQNGEGVMNRVAPNFFPAFEVRGLAGRMFTPADYAAGSRSIIVNRSFVQHYFDGGNALGLRLRPVPSELADKSADVRPEPWWEIVGVVDDFPALAEPDAYRPKMYLPLRPGEAYPMTLAVRSASGTPALLATRIREVATSVDPSLRFIEIRLLQDRLDDEEKVLRLTILGLVMVTISVVLLSAAGIYALMSFTVARRRREIGIRTALGAGNRRVVLEVLSSGIRQIGFGIAIGMILAAVLGRVLAPDSTSVVEYLLWLLAFAATMAAIGVVATLGPARRALQVQPTEALKSG